MRFSLVLILLFLSSCTIYSSAGRKDFESKSPDYVKTQAFTGCEPVTQEDYDEGFLDSFASRSFHRDPSFWVAADPATPQVIQVLNHTKEEVCTYQFASQEDWQSTQAYFLQHLP
jgi:hypothetical protein